MAAKRVPSKIQRRIREKQNANLIPFKKADPRINRKGRPKSFDAARALAQSIGAEELPNSGMTRVEAKFRMMASSKNPADSRTFLEYAYGKPKEEVENSGELVIKIVRTSADEDGRVTPADAAPEAGADEAGSEKV